MSFLSLTGRTWIWPKPLPEKEIQKESTLPWWAEVLLERRGIEEDEAINNYLQPSLSTLEDPLVMAGMKEALARITQAIEKDLHAYLAAVINGEGGHTLIVNGMPDHVHILARMPHAISVSDMMRRIKGCYCCRSPSGA